MGLLSRKLEVREAVRLISLVAISCFLVSCSTDSESSPASPVTTMLNSNLVKPQPGEVGLVSYEYTLTDEECDARFGEYSGTLDVSVFDSRGPRSGSVRVVAMGLRDGNRVEVGQDIVFVGRDQFGRSPSVDFKVNFREQITDCELMTLYMD